MLVVIAFGVNIAWGIIDGATVIYGGLTDKADLEKIISRAQEGPEQQGIKRQGSGFARGFVC